MTEKNVDLKTVKKLRKQGMKLRDIGKFLKVSHQTIANKWKAAGLPPLGDIRSKCTSKWIKRRDDMQKMFDRGQTMKEVGDFYGVSPSTIAGVCNRYNITVMTAAKKKRIVLANKVNASRSRIKSCVAYKERIEALPPNPETVCDILGLELGRCHYIVRENGGVLYCGSTTETELSSWCPYHAKIVYGLLGDVAEASRSGGIPSNEPSCLLTPGNSAHSASHSDIRELV